MANDSINESPTSASPLYDGENDENRQEAGDIGRSVDDVETKEVSDDLEEGELLDDGETDERAEESEIVDPPAPAAIPSLLDMKISPPPNGVLSVRGGRWTRKLIGRRRRVVAANDDDDSDNANMENDSDGQLRRLKKQKNRSKDGKKTRATYVDHDRADVDSDDADYSSVAWPGFGKKSTQSRITKGSSGHMRSARLQYDSPPGAYDSPYSSPPGPYDSPESDAENDESASKEVSTRPNISDDIAVHDDSEQISSEQSGSVDQQLKHTDSETDLSATEKVCKRRTVQVKREDLSQCRDSGSPDREPPVKRRRLVDTPWEQRPVCKFYLDGKCGKGSDCPFNHTGPRRDKKPYLCRYYRSGHCSKSQHCSYHHETWPCTQFHRDGSCDDGERCRYSHQELTDETRPLLETMERTDNNVADDTAADHEPQPKKKSLLGDYPQPQLLPPLTNAYASASDRDRRKIPSLFDFRLPSATSSSSSMSSSTIGSMSDAGLRPPPSVPRGFPSKNVQPGILGPGPALPPHVAFRFMRMRVPPPVTFPLADVPQFPFDPSLVRLPPTETSGPFNAAVLPTSNVATMPPFTTDLTATLPAGNNIAVADTMSQVCAQLPTVPHFPPTSAVEPPTATVDDVTSWQPSIVAGVDLNQLPPPQRQLFLRLHHQQQTETPADSTHLSAAPSQTIGVPMIPSSVNQTAAVQQTSAASNEQPNSVVDVLQSLIQPSRSSATVPRLPIAPVFDINQVLSAINQTVPVSAVPPAMTGTSGSYTAGWQHEFTKSDAELEVNGLRAEMNYTVQPIDCLGTVIPAYMDINDPRWDGDPRVQHWRREVELGRMPRRETPKTPASGSSSAAQRRPVRDPRLKTDSGALRSQQQPVVTTSELPQQQVMIHADTSHTSSVPLSQPALSTSQSQITAPQPPTGDVSRPLGPVPPASMPQNNSSSAPPPRTDVAASSTGSDVVETFKVPESVAPSSSPSNSVASKDSATSRAELASGDHNELRSTGKRQRVDHRDNPRFKRRKTKSQNVGGESATDSSQSTSESIGVEAAVKDRGLVFQSPLAATDNVRVSSATSSGYNRPPNRRYQQLLERGNQPTSQSRPKPSSAPAHDVLSAIAAVITYPSIISHDALASDSRANGSLKDMFKTIDPTASPFC